MDHNSSAYPEVIVKGFKKCCISSALGETDVNTFLIGSEEVANIRNEGEEDEGSDTDW
jgi:hypothetical protein